MPTQRIWGLINGVILNHTVWNGSLYTIVNATGFNQIFLRPPGTGVRGLISKFSCKVNHIRTRLCRTLVSKSQPTRSKLMMHIQNQCLPTRSSLFLSLYFSSQGRNTFPRTLEFRIKGASRKDSHAHCISE